MKKENNFNDPGKKHRIMIAPLDWGLGHATRCIPIIKELIYLNCKVFIAVDKKIFSLLKKEFPDAVFLLKKGYEIEYSSNAKNFHIKLLLQLPKLFFSILKEKKWLKKIVKEHAIDAVISDNRFGMYHKKIPSVYITHQLFIKTGSRFTEIIAQKIHYFFIKKYDCCWIPDFKENGLSGELSHPKENPQNVIYIGPLSRFASLQNVEKIYDLLITISGPEPQRTIFENNILNQLKNFSGKGFMVRGLPAETKKIENFNLIKIENHLGAVELNKVIEQSKRIISRSGYTTVMDLALLKAKAILIPTSGQTEQEYLAKYLLEKKYFYSVEQKDFSLEDALKKSTSFEFKTFDFSGDEYKKLVRDFINSLNS